MFIKTPETPWGDPSFNQAGVVGLVPGNCTNAVVGIQSPIYATTVDGTAKSYYINRSYRCFDWMKEIETDRKLDTELGEITLRFFAAPKALSEEEAYWDILIKSPGAKLWSYPFAKEMYQSEFCNNEISPYNVVQPMSALTFLQSRTEDENKHKELVQLAQAEVNNHLTRAEDFIRNVEYVAEKCKLISPQDLSVVLADTFETTSGNFGFVLKKSAAADDRARTIDTLLQLSMEKSNIYNVISKVVHNPLEIAPSTECIFEIIDKDAFAGLCALLAAN